MCLHSLLVDGIFADLNVSILAYKVPPSSGRLRSLFVITNFDEGILLHLLFVLCRESGEVLHEILFNLVPINFALNLVLILRR